MTLEDDRSIGEFGYNRDFNSLAGIQERATQFGARAMMCIALCPSLAQADAERHGLKLFEPSEVAQSCVDNNANYYRDKIGVFCFRPRTGVQAQDFWIGFDGNKYEIEEVGSSERKDILNLCKNFGWDYVNPVFGADYCKDSAVFPPALKIFFKKYFDVKQDRKTIFSIQTEDDKSHFFERICDAYGLGSGTSAFDNKMTWCYKPRKFEYDPFEFEEGLSPTIETCLNSGRDFVSGFNMDVDHCRNSHGISRKIRNLFLDVFEGEWRDDIFVMFGEGMSGGESLLQDFCALFDLDYQAATSDMDARCGYINRNYSDAFLHAGQYFEAIDQLKPEDAKRVFQKILAPNGRTYFTFDKVDLEVVR